jgi:hypothetical protein
MATANHAIDTPFQIAWQPQPGPQTLLLACPFDEIFYGGARGGGKTSGLLGHWLKHSQRWGRHAKGIIVRQTYPELKEIREQAEALFPLVGGHYRSGEKTWKFRNGSKLLLGHLDTDKDAKRVLGQQYSWEGIEEITNWATPDPIKKLKACLRSAYGVRCQWVATGNPGGPGHNWVKTTYIDPMPPLAPYCDPKTHITRIFIPAKLQDNKILMASDPTYVDRLKDSGPEWLVKAWLDGNWDIVAGGMFDDLWDRTVHILEHFVVPRTWTIERAFDWGSSKPFSIGWWATCNGEQVQNQRFFYPGTKIRIAEWYGWDGKTPNKGSGEVDSEIARKALQMEQQMSKAHGYVFRPGPADPSIFTVKDGLSTGMTLARLGLSFKPAATGAGSRTSGWAQVRMMLKAAKQPKMEEPGLFVFSSCRQFIRTVPTLPRDVKNLDDVDTDAEDHIGDETRYAVTTKQATVMTQKLVGV